jgi:hypothetical protein
MPVGKEQMFGFIWQASLIALIYSSVDSKIELVLSMK